MDGIEIKLLMSFMTSSGRKVSLFVTDPREDVTENRNKTSYGLNNWEKYLCS